MEILSGKQMYENDLLIDNEFYFIKNDKYSEWNIARYESHLEAFRVIWGTIYEFYTIEFVVKDYIIKPL